MLSAGDITDQRGEPADDWRLFAPDEEMCQICFIWQFNQDAMRHHRRTKYHKIRVTRVKRYFRIWAGACRNRHRAADFEVVEPEVNVEYEIVS